MAIRDWFTSPKQDTGLADLLGNGALRDDLIGMSKITPPSPDQILTDANKILSYASQSDYKVWAKEVWAHIITHLDVIQDPKASMDEVNFHRGALRQALDLLRVSYRARLLKEQLEAEQEAPSRLSY
jgi:hypothetical protein